MLCCWIIEEIVRVIDKWSADDSECPNDECNGNISTVFTHYYEEKYHLELIVRPVQIQAEFDDNEDRLRSLEDIYKLLFDFWRQHVLPDLKNYSKRNPKVDF